MDRPHHSIVCIPEAEEPKEGFEEHWKYLKRERKQTLI